MSYDGSGTYTPPSPEYPAVAGSLIKSADFNGIVTDIAAALSLALVRDGRAPMTGDLSLGTHKITNVVNGANPQDATTFLQVFTSPAFTGNPTAPTQTPLDNSTKLATTAYVDAADALKATIASPTLTGDPKAPTPAPGDNDTSIATTAFVQGEIALKAPLASPALTGTPTAPTAANGTNNTQIATTAFAVQLAFAAALPAQILDGLGYTLRSQDGTAFWGSAIDIYSFENMGGF